MTTEQKSKQTMKTALVEQLFHTPLFQQVWYEHGLGLCDILQQEQDNIRIKNTYTRPPLTAKVLTDTYKQCLMNDDNYDDESSIHEVIDNTQPVEEAFQKLFSNYVAPEAEPLTADLLVDCVGKCLEETYTNCNVGEIQDEPEPLWQAFADLLSKYTSVVSAQDARIVQYMKKSDDESKKNEEQAGKEYEERQARLAEAKKKDELAVQRFREEEEAKVCTPKTKRAKEAVAQLVDYLPSECAHLTVKQYKRSVLVTGDTKPHKEVLKNAGGNWNNLLKGWVFSPSKIDAMKEKSSGVDIKQDRKSNESIDTLRSVLPFDSTHLTIAPYKRSVLVTGDTKPHKNELRSAGGKWNGKLEGWVFSPTRIQEETQFAWLKKLLSGDTSKFTFSEKEDGSIIVHWMGSAKPYPHEAVESLRKLGSKEISLSGMTGLNPHRMFTAEQVEKLKAVSAKGSKEATQWWFNAVQLQEQIDEQADENAATVWTDEQVQDVMRMRNGCLAVIEIAQNVNRTPEEVVVKIEEVDNMSGPSAEKTMFAIYRGLDNIFGEMWNNGYDSTCMEDEEDKIKEMFVEKMQETELKISKLARDELAEKLMSAIDNVFVTIEIDIHEFLEDDDEQADAENIRGLKETFVLAIREQQPKFLQSRTTLPTKPRVKLATKIERKKGMVDWDEQDKEAHGIHPHARCCHPDKTLKAFLKERIPNKKELNKVYNKEANVFAHQGCYWLMDINNKEAKDILGRLGLESVKEDSKIWMVDTNKGSPSSSDGEGSQGEGKASFKALRKTLRKHGMTKEQAKGLTYQQHRDSILVTGDTKPHKAVLKAAGGKKKNALGGYLFTTE